ncbi:MAG: hypothetical protein JWO96_557 [Candidatus Saccharibacteria bacterium]|nr:hypothetical protein [Candidatus Saccharibacteria bacterium]
MSRNFEFLLYDPRKFFAVAAVLLLVAPISLVGLLESSAKSLTINSPRDCDSNAVIRCGALNFTELENRSQQPGVTEIFNSFGISPQEIAGARQTAVEGSVTSSNTVIVDGQVVATNAVTAGRQNMSGSTAVTSGGVTFFRRPPSVSFVSSPLPAFVFMNNGRFSSAIIASCGNPVIATPVPQTPRPARIVPTPAPTPTPTPTPTTTTPPAVIQPQPVTVINNNTQTQQQQQQQQSAPTTSTTPTTPTTSTPTTPTTPTPSTPITSPTPSQTQTQAQSQTAPVPQAQSQNETTAAVVPTTPTAQQAAAPAASTTPTTLPNTGSGDGVFVISGAATVVGTIGHMVYQRRRL